MDFIAVLNYEHLDNGLFLTSFAKSLAKRNKQGIILHESSEYTERIIQTGVMREEATIRCLKELNHRLVALFADEGISTIGLNGHQKSLLLKSTNNNQLKLNAGMLRSLPDKPMILISALASVKNSHLPVIADVSEMATIMRKEFDLSYIDTFSIKEKSEIIVDDLPGILTPAKSNKEIIEEHVPLSFRSYTGAIRLHSPSTF